MTTERLTSDDPIWAAMIQAEEGYGKALPDGRCIAYPDPLSARAKTGSGPGDPWTIGFGSTGEHIVEGVVWTRALAELRCAADRAAAIRELDEHMPWWRGMSLVRQRVLADMVYNMGLHRLSGFAHFLAACQAGDWAKAVEEMADSAWARQTKSRAVNLEHLMEQG